MERAFDGRLSALVLVEAGEVGDRQVTTPPTPLYHLDYLADRPRAMGV